MKTFKLSVITPIETLLEIPHCQKAQVQLADGGGIGILPNHAPLIAETRQANIRYTNNSGEHHIEVGAGILQIDDLNVTIFTSGWTKDIEQAAPSAGSKLHSPLFNRLVQNMLTELDIQNEQHERNGDA